MKRLFVTGTDTEIGKTWVSRTLTRALVRSGYRVAVMKPVASGCISTPEGLRSEDALQLMQVANADQAYEAINPYAYEPAIAPHIAAAEVGIEPDPQRIRALAGEVVADVLLVEGVGGWCVPLGPELMVADLVRALDAEVILVVGMKLGCINHALLSFEVITGQGFDVCGWVANRVDPAMERYAENLEALKRRLGAPLIMEVEHGVMNAAPGAEFMSALSENAP